MSIQICEELLTRCLAPDCQMGGLGCDNMTVVLVCLLQDEPWEKYVERCARPPAQSTTTGDEQTTSNRDGESSEIMHGIVQGGEEDGNGEDIGNEQFATPQPSPVQTEMTGIRIIFLSNIPFFDSKFLFQIFPVT